MNVHSLFSNAGTFVLGLTLISAPLVSMAGFHLETAAPGPTQTCSTLTIKSDAGTKAAGYHESVVGLANATQGLNPSNYSLGAMTGSAVATTPVIPPWIDPAVDVNFTGSQWISTNLLNNEGNPTLNQWRLFSEGFTLPAGAIVSSATLAYTADNAADVYLNGNTTPISTTGDTYGTPVATPNNFGAVFTTNFTPVIGNNTLSFVARNWGGAFEANPTGLLFKAKVEYCVPTVSTPQSGVVHIEKYVGKHHATTEKVNGVAFPMITPTYGNAPFTLSSTGWTAGDMAYEASTGVIPGGNTYTAYEKTDTALVGMTCADNKPYALIGYSHGATMALAEVAPKTLTAPILTVNGDQYLIVWNKKCSDNEDQDGELDGDVVSNDGALVVTSIDMIDTTATANGSFTDGWKYAFHITAPMSEEDLSMKFSDWLRNGGGGTIPVGSNMRISSLQANNSGATVLLTAANLYSSPVLTMTSDLNAGLIGRQVIITVEVSIPTGTPNGSYNTSYGLQSN